LENALVDPVKRRMLFSRVSVDLLPFGDGGQFASPLTRRVMMPVLEPASPKACLGYDDGMGDMSAQVPEYYADQFGLAVGPYGCAMSFGLSDPHGAPGQPIVSVRTSLEHLKVIAFLIHKQILIYQSELNVDVPLPDKALESIKTTREEWLRFWSKR
jgi:hypothetical protein